MTIDPTSGPSHVDLTEDHVDRDRDPFDRMAEEFADRCRKGENPSISEFEGRHPDDAEKVRKLLNAVAMMEQLRRGSRQARTIPERIGEYQIVRELGRGGMGVVYEAIQEPLGRRVAVKAIHHIHLDPIRLQRFSREAQAVARLHHTNIVPIFGFGEQDGLPYYAMQYIRGQGLDALLAAWRVDGVVKPESRWRFVASLGVQVARALDYAHDQGVLHRDVKPANLLIDEYQSVWITDFGLAKLVGQNDLTASGDVVGTLRYLAPEALRGESDHRSDIYSLGLTLYEALTLNPPFGDLSPSELLRQVSESRLARPRSLDPSIPRDLETIVLKAIARDPDHRYASAGALASDLQCFLEDRAINARRETSVERAWRWSRRNRGTAALVATAAGSLVMAALFGWVGYASTTKALARESIKRHEAEVATRRADENFALSLEVFEKLFNDLSPQVDTPPPRPRRVDHHDGPGPDKDPDHHRPPMGGKRGGDGPIDQDRPPMDGPGGPGWRGVGFGSQANSDLLRSVLTFYDRFARSNETNPRLQAEAAWAYFKVAGLTERLGREDEAEKAFQRAVEMFESLVERYPEVPEYSDKLVRISVQVDPWSASELSLRRMEGRLIRVQTLIESLAQASPENLNDRMAQARACLKLATVRQRLERPAPETEAGYRRAIDLMGSIIAQNPQLDRPRIDLADGHESLATLLIKQGRTAEAVALLKAAAADLQALSPQERYAPPTADRFETLGETFGLLGEGDLAREMTRITTEIRARPRRPMPPPSDLEPFE